MNIIKKTALIVTTMFLALGTLTYLPSSRSYGASVSKDTSWFDDNNRLNSYKITTEQQLIGLASLVNEEQTDKWKRTRIENFEGVTFTLMKDIELTQKWKPIGYDSSSHFSGIFDGNGHTISGLNVKQQADYAGFFGYLTGEVRDLTITGRVNCESAYCGSVAGYMDVSAKILNCSSMADIHGNEKTGGIAGENHGGLIEGCYNTGEITGTFRVGGIVGENWGGEISKCGNEGSVTSTKRGVATYGTGGIAGRSVSYTSAVTECYNVGNIKSDTEATGGVVGYSNTSGALIKSCYNTGSVRIMNGKDVNTQIKTYAGGVAGIVGMKGVVVKDCYNTGKITDATVTGGVIGRYNNESENSDVFIDNNYYVKNITPSGIGICQDKKNHELDNAATAAFGSLTGLASSLGPSFTNEIYSSYNNGAPVLKWQKPVDKNEKVYNGDLSIELQLSLDQYLVDTADEEVYGQSIMDAFNPQNILSGTAAVYGEIKDQLPNIKIPKNK